MTRHGSIGATRMGGSSSADVERGVKPVARQRIEYWCAEDHCTSTVLAANVVVPETWECGRCGHPALTARGTAPPVTRTSTFFRTPYEFLMMRRTPEEGELLLAEALADLHRD